MGRFLQSNPTPSRPSYSAAPRSVVASTPAPVSTPPSPTPAAPPNLFEKLALFLVCIYILAALANDLSFRLLGGKAYLSLIAGAALPFVCLFAGTLLRPFRFPVGKVWSLYLLWLVVTIPFSVWKGGSASQVLSVMAKNFLMLFYIAAAASDLKSCSKLFYTQILGAITVLVSCAAFGQSVGARLRIPESLFFDNPNDLATHLLISGVFLLFLLFSPKIPLRLVGLALMAATLFALLKTGSRGLFIALVFCILAAFFLSRHRILLLAVAVPVAVLSLLTLPSATRSRLFSIVLSEEAAPMTEDGDYGSQLERVEMLKKGIAFTLSHPLFGVGPGMFAEAVRGEDQQKGSRTPFLNTHNTYVQVSSESGFPGLIFYVATLIFTLGMNYRVFRLSHGVPHLYDVWRISFTLLIATVGYAGACMFHHLAYTAHLPILAGMSIALQNAVSRVEHAQLQS
jgi:O-antigen ligase